MAEGTRESLRDHIHKLIEKDPEGLVDLFVDQHLAVESLSQTVKTEQSVVEFLARKIAALERRLGDDSQNSHKLPSTDNPFAQPENKTVHQPLKGQESKARTYRQRARKDYLKVAKKRKVGLKELRKGF